LGTTQLEKADAPLGLVYGKVIVSEETFGYHFLKVYVQGLKRYCVRFGEEIKIESIINVETAYV
jgi:hypothetical protein